MRSLAATLLCLHTTLGAQTVVVEQRVLMGENRTPAAAKRLAREEAMAEAVRQVAGVRVRSSAIATTAETSRGITSDYRSVVQLDAAGRAVDVQLLSEVWEPGTVPGAGAQLYYRASFSVTVVREQGEPDASFRLELQLARTELVAASAHLRDNDELVAAVRSTRQATVFLFSLDGDSLTALVPNDYVAGVPVMAGDSVEVPDPTWRARGLHFRVVRDQSRPLRDELLVAIAVTGAPPSPPRSGTVLDLQRWLVSIPAAQRSSAFAPYTVRMR